MKLSKQFRLIALDIIDALPSPLQRAMHNLVSETKYVVFTLNVANEPTASTNISKIYFISPSRIIYHTNYLEKGQDNETPFRDRVFPERMRGQIVDGDWDLPSFKFTDLDVYGSFKARIEKDVEWTKTPLYDRLLQQAKLGHYSWGIKDTADLSRNFDRYDRLIKSIMTFGYLANHSNGDESTSIDEIEVNIGRNGQYLFQNGVHRLSIAKILGVKTISVMVFARHKQWQEFRNFVLLYARQNNGELYQPLVHPDLADIPYAEEETHNYSAVMSAIRANLGKEKGVMLDIGCNTGYFCHKFEDLGYECYAVEKDPVCFAILEKVRIAENKKFSCFNMSVLDASFIKDSEFDVVLALNIFHHFLKRREDCFKLIDLLENLKTAELFFEPSLCTEEQMKDAYINFTDSEFVAFLLKHTSLTKSKEIFVDKNGRRIYKLSK